MTREQLLAAAFLELAAETLADDFDVLGYLQCLVDRSTQVMGASAAGLILADQRGEFQLISSSSHTAQVLELMSASAADGPCLESFRLGEPIVNVPAEEAAARWPGFARAALALGYGATHVLPLQFRSHVLGALALFFTDPVRLTEDDESVAAALVGVATVGLLHERTPRQKELLAERLQDALTTRAVVEQAKGVVAERAGVGVDEAFDLISGYSRSRGRRLSDVAARLLEGRIGVEHLREPS